MVLGKARKATLTKGLDLGKPSHYRTHAGAEVDLVLKNPSGETVALEIKRTLPPELTPGFVESMKTLQATRGNAFRES